MALPLAALAAIPGIASTGFGIYQALKGANNLEKLKANAPQYEIPQEISSKLSNATLMAIQGLPDEQKKQFVENVQRTSQFGLKSLSDRQSGIAGVAELAQNETDAYTKMLVADATAKMDNQKYLGDVFSEMAMFKDKAFDVNKYRPYVRDYNQALADKVAGEKNIMSGLQSTTEGLMGAGSLGKTGITGLGKV